MSALVWITWGLALIAQNAAFTWVSRARNSGSLAYHGFAAIFSNGIWIISMFFIVDQLARAKGDVKLMIVTGLFYTACTVCGSVLMHYVSMRWLEKGKRKVGA